MCSAASTPVPAATSPTSGTWRTGRRSTIAPEPDSKHDLDRAGLGRVAPEEALVLQGGEVGVDRGARREPDGLADLADAGRVAALADLARR